MAKDSIFEYKDFRKYLSYRLSIHGSSRGMRSELAGLLRVRPASITHLISGAVQMSLEHVPVINKLLEHNEEESEFFMLLVSYTQAGTRDLQHYFKKKMDQLLESKQIRADWIAKPQAIDSQIEAYYCSDWYYHVIHTLTHIPAFQTKAAISDKLDLSLSTVTTALEFLVSAGLVEKYGDRFRATERRIHIKKDSPWAVNMHMHARQLVIRSLSERKADDLHYAFVMSISKADMERVRKIIQKAIEEIEPMVTESGNEELCLMAVDFSRWR